MNRLTTVVATLALLTAAGARAEDPQVKKLQAAREVYLELMQMPDQHVPARLLRDARCIAVIPSVIKGAFIWGGRHGRGVMTCRDDAGDWSPVIFVRITGGSFGLQAGGQATDLVLFFMTERGARSLMTSKFVLGGDVAVAAGPVGRSAEATTDIKLRAEIYSYAKAKGLFAGIAIDGARLAPDRKWIRRLYGEEVASSEVLFDRTVPRDPPESRTFRSVLP